MTTQDFCRPQLVQEHTSATPDQRAHHWDAVDTYLTCLTTCDLEDRECSTRCVEVLRMSC
jgi:hypothetical protein|nr:hypothetical protein [Cyanobium sp. LEGE 06143]